MKYAIYNKDGFIGMYEWDGSKEVIDSEDKKLLDLVKAPYTTLSGFKDPEAFVTTEVTYDPNTLEHYNALIIEMHQFGFDVIDLEA